MRELITIISEKEVKRRTNIRTNEHHKIARRNKNGLTKRQQEKQDKIKAVKELKDKGLMQKEIAKELKISIATIKRYYALIQRSEEHTSELQSRQYLVCRLLLEKKKP